YDDVNLTSGITMMRLTKSTDGGNSFTEVSTIVNGSLVPQDHVAPYLALDSNDDIHFAWLWITNSPWGDIYLKSSHDNGSTFSTAIDINPDGENGTFSDAGGRPAKISLPVIRFDQNNRLYALWCDNFETGGTWDVYLRYSDDSGSNWSQRYQINPSTAGNQWLPDMDIDSKGHVHVVYYDENDGQYRPYYRNLIFPESGEPVFHDPLPVASAYTSNFFTRPGDYFTVRVDSADIPHVVWTDGRYDEMDIYYSHGIPVNGETTTTSSITTTASTVSSSSVSSQDSETEPLTSPWTVDTLLIAIIALLGYHLRKKRSS
ncbi:MAG: sialidase family protein, partial [Candidatus Hodarchaeales archaeon]